MNYKLAIYCVFLYLSISCTKEQYIFMNAFKGNIYDASSLKPIENVKIYVDSSAFNSFQPILTNKDGYFFVNGMTTNNKKDFNTFKHYTSLKVFIEKENYVTDTIDLTQFNTNENIDTIHLNIIHLNQKY